MSNEQTPDQSAADTDAVEIVQNLQKLNDIEGDLAETAVAVAAEAPTSSASSTGILEQPQTTDESSTAPSNVGVNANADASQALLQTAEGIEDALEQVIPAAPEPLGDATSTSHELQTDHAHASVAAEEVDEVIEAVKKDDEPILPADIRPLAALDDAAPLPEVHSNADEFQIDDPSASSVDTKPEVDVAPAETHAPDQTLSGQQVLHATDEGYKPEPSPTASVQSTPVPVPGRSLPAGSEVQTRAAEVEEQKLDLPEGLTMQSASVSQNRGIAQDYSNGELVHLLRTGVDAGASTDV